MKFLRLKSIDKALLAETGYVLLESPSNKPEFCNQTTTNLLDLPLVYVQSDGMIWDNHSTLGDYWKGDKDQDLDLAVHAAPFKSTIIVTSESAKLLAYTVDAEALIKKHADKLDIDRLGRHYIPPIDNDRLFLCTGALVREGGTIQITHEDTQTTTSTTQTHWIGCRLIELKRKPKVLR